MRAWGKRCLDIRLHSKTLTNGILGEEASCEHDVGVRRVCARCNSGDNQVTLVKGIVNTFISELCRFCSVLLFEAETLKTDWGGHASVKVLLHVCKVNTIVRSLRSGKRWLNGAKIKLHNFARVFRVSLRSIVLDEHILLAQIFFDELNMTFITTSEAHVLHGTAIDGEVSHSGTILRSHVGDSGSISKGQRLDTRSEEFDEFTNDTALSQHLDAG